MKWRLRFAGKMRSYRAMKNAWKGTMISISALTILGTNSASAGGGRGAQKSYLVYVGTYTAPATKSQGIYVYRFASGRLTPLGLAAESVNPSFLAADPNHKFLYAVNELQSYEGQKSGGVSAFAIDRKTGKLNFLNEVASGGTDPCFISLDKTGKYILVANYSSGSAAAFAVQADGRLGERTAFVQHTGTSVDSQRQEGPHAHAIEVSPDNRFVLVADLGLDELLVYRFDAARGTLTPNQSPFAKVTPGAGPRHFVFDPSGKYVYLVSEMKSLVTAFSYNAAKGTLRDPQTIAALPKDFAGESTAAEIALDNSGKFLYASNRGHDSIAVFAVDAAQHTLSPVAHVPTQGKTPRHFALDPSGAYLFAENQDSNDIVVFRVDPKTGSLTPTGEKLDVPAPVCMIFVPEE